jgi:hypothetical protein
VVRRKDVSCDLKQKQEQQQHARTHAETNLRSPRRKLHKGQFGASGQLSESSFEFSTWVMAIFDADVSEPHDIQLSAGQALLVLGPRELLHKSFPQQQVVLARKRTASL